ncbi:HvfB family MNIO-type RiPP peptide maturase [Pseudoalteromonas xiamenensis]
MTTGFGQVGLGFRRDMLDELDGGVPDEIDFFEIAPENWMTLGGRFSKQLAEFTSHKPFLCHGLSLSIGSYDPLDMTFLKKLKTFLKDYNIRLYSEHLSYCSADGHMYDLMPIPFTEDAINHTVARIKRVQDVLERPLVLENVSYYCAPGQTLTEQEFTLAILEESGCQLLLDVNNIYVNSVNHKYDAEAFLKAMPTGKIVYGHIAGHYVEAEDLIVDTHGSAVASPVWALLEKAYEIHGVFPTLLERDFNIPQMGELITELKDIKRIQRATARQPNGVKTNAL